MRLHSLALLGATAALMAACAESGTQHSQSGFDLRIGVMPSATAGAKYRENVRSLDGPQSVALVTGNTVAGRYTDTPGTFFDYFAPDGRFVSLEPDGAVYPGRWKARYTEFCIEYDSHPHLAYQRCFSFFESGDGRFTSFRPGGTGFYDIDIITPGNVKDLPLE